MRSLFFFTDNFPPKIETVSNAINATLGDTVHLSIRAVDNDTIKFRVINNPEGATWNQTGNLLYFTWLVTTSRKVCLPTFCLFKIENVSHLIKVSDMVCKVLSFASRESVISHFAA